MEMDGNEAVAMGYYRIAFEYDPGSRDLCFILTDRYKDQNLLDSALDLGRKCLTLAGGPTSDEYQSLGEIYLRLDSLPAALDSYRHAVSLDESDKDALYTLATLYERDRDWKHYAAAMDKLLPEIDYPEHLVEKQIQTYRLLDRASDALPLLRAAWEKTGRPAYGENLAAYYEAEGDGEAFLKMAESLVSAHPDHPEYALLRARALNACGLVDSALGIYRDLLKDHPDEREVLYPYGALLHDAGRYQEAYPVFEKLAQAFPQEPMYRYFLGSTGLELHQPKSLEALRDAAEAEPAVPDYWASLAYGDLVFGHDSAADSCLAHVPDSLSEAWQAPFFQGLVHTLLAQYLEQRRPTGPASPLYDTVAARRYRRRSVQFLRAALAQSPHNSRILFELGTNLERLGERAESMDCLRQVVQADSDDAMAMNYLGYMLVEDNRDLDSAGHLIDHALALEPENPAYLDSKGWWDYRKGDFAAARTYLEKASVRIPDDPTILQHLATVLDALGQRQDAHQVWVKLLQVDPDNIEAKQKAEGKAQGKNAQPALAPKAANRDGS